MLIFVLADYVLRSKAISCGLVQKVKVLNYNSFHALNMDQHEYYKFQGELLKAQHGELYDEAVKCAASDFARNTRLKKRIEKFFSLGDCLFLTFTFTDNALEKTSPKYRRKQVSEYLRSFSDHFVGNIDFGGRYGREHYHAIIVADHVDFKSWKHGNLDCERIYKGSTPLHLAKYVSKLASHAIKETTKRNSLIYSRCK